MWRTQSLVAHALHIAKHVTHLIIFPRQVQAQKVSNRGGGCALRMRDINFKVQYTTQKYIFVAVASCMIVNNRVCYRHVGGWRKKWSRFIVSSCSDFIGTSEIGSTWGRRRLDPLGDFIGTSGTKRFGLGTLGWYLAQSFLNLLGLVWLFLVFVCICCLIID